jgi:hypothetical protein
MLVFGQRLIFFFFLFIYLPIQAQQSDIEFFKKAEDSCMLYSKQINADLPDQENLDISKKLSTNLKNFLNTPGSFNYPLDSIKSLGTLYAPDKSFRIISWNIPLNSGEFKYYGFIQVYNSKSNSTRCFELTDRSDEITNPENSVLSAGKWFGAIYYKILKEKVDNRTYYTMMGVQYHNLVITRKMVEILFFDEYGNPVFGAPIIQINNKKKLRLVFDYSALASVHLNYDEKLKMIVFDHVAAAEPKYNGQFEYYGPDLTFDGLVFKKGLWIYTPNLDLRQPFSTAPKHKPLR